MAALKERMNIMRCRRAGGLLRARHLHGTSRAEGQPRPTKVFPTVRTPQCGAARIAGPVQQAPTNWQAYV